MMPVSVDSSLQRAHRTVDARLPDHSQQATLRSLGDEALREIVDEFVSAWEQADVDAVVAMLADGASLTMPPVPTWFQGREAVGALLARVPLAGPRWRLVPTRANGQPALGQYIWDAERGPEKTDATARPPGNRAENLRAHRHLRMLASALGIVCERWAPPIFASSSDQQPAVRVLRGDDVVAAVGDLRGHRVIGDFNRDALVGACVLDDVRDCLGDGEVDRRVDGGCDAVVGHSKLGGQR